MYALLAFLKTDTAVWGVAGTAWMTPEHCSDRSQLTSVLLEKLYDKLSFDC